MTGVLATVPTLKENGLDVVVDNFRLALGTAKLQPAQIAWWDNVLGQLAHSAEWRKDLDDNHWENTYLDSQNTRIFLDAQYAKWQEALRELGMAK